MTVDNEINDLINDFLRVKIREYLAGCSEANYAGFFRIWPNGVDSIPNTELKSALELCRRSK